MTIAVIALSVIVPLETIRRRWPGGELAYEASVPNQSFRTDGQLAAVEFAMPSEVGWWTDEVLADQGITYLRDGRAVDAIVVDSRQGPCAPCDWVGFERPGAWGLVTAVGSAPGTPLGPEGWSPSDVPPTFISNEELGGRARFVALQDGGAEFIDEASGEGRIIPTTDPALFSEILANRLRVLGDRVWDAKGQIEQSSVDPLPVSLRELLANAADEGQRIASFLHDPEISRAALHIAGLAARVNGDWEIGLRCFTALSKQLPDDVEARLEIAWCLSELGRYGEALAQARRAVQIDPRNSSAIANVGAVLLKMRRLDEARSWIHRSLAIAPDDPITQKLLALHEAAVADDREKAK